MIRREYNSDILYYLCRQAKFHIHLDSWAMIDSAASSNELGALHHIIFDVILPLVDAVTHSAIKYYVGVFPAHCDPQKQPIASLHFKWPRNRHKDRLLPATVSGFPLQSDLRDCSFARQRSMSGLGRHQIRKMRLRVDQQWEIEEPPTFPSVRWPRHHPVSRSSRSLQKLENWPSRTLSLGNAVPGIKCHRGYIEREKSSSGDWWDKGDVNLARTLPLLSVVRHRSLRWSILSRWKWTPYVWP